MKKATKKRVLPLLVFFFVISPFVCMGEKNKTVSSKVSEKVQTTMEEKIPMCIDFKKADRLGRVLGLKIEEKIISSNIFKLIKGRSKCIKVSILSQPEFHNTSLRSVVSVVWSLYYGEDVISSFLDHKIVIIDRQTLDIEADDILALTTNISEEYAYLLK